jgi:hypothetical protein
MNGSLREIGCGYAFGARQYNHFWTQDFSTASSEYTHPVSAGAHFNLSGAVTQFMASYKDASGKPPVYAEVVIGGKSYSLALTLGMALRGFTA